MYSGKSRDDRRRKAVDKKSRGDGIYGMERRGGLMLPMMSMEIENDLLQRRRKRSSSSSAASPSQLRNGKRKGVVVRNGG